MYLKLCTRVIAGTEKSCALCITRTLLLTLRKGDLIVGRGCYHVYREFVDAVTPVFVLARLLSVAA